MEERYQMYLRSFGLSEEPKTFEEFVSYQTEQDEKVAKQQAAIAEIMSQIAPLYTIKKTPESRTEAQQMLRTLQTMSQNLTAKESNKNVILAHTQALKVAKSILLDSFNKAAKPEKSSMTSTNVYDNDNRPTSY